MKHISILILLCCNLYSIAQQNTTAAGGNATGAGGSVSYSIGQIDYIAETGAGGNANQGVQQPSLPCPTVTSANVVACPGVPISLVGTPGGGVFSVANPYLGPNTTYTYTYTDLGIGCSVTSSPSTITNSVMTPAIITTPITATTTTATVTWTAVPGATIYYLWYRPVGNISWNTPTTAGTSLLLTGLLPNTIYECKIRNNNALCGQFGSFGALENFTTMNDPCGTASTFITPFALTNSSALIKWNALYNTAQYNVWYKKSSDAIWSTMMFGGATTQHLKTGLLPNTMYDVAIRNRCNGEPSFTGFGAIYTFGTPLKQGMISNEIANVRVFPNPTNDVLNIEFEGLQNSNSAIKIYDVTGRLLKQVQANTQVGLNQLSISMAPFANGIYTIQLFEGETLMYVGNVNKNE